MSLLAGRNVKEESHTAARPEGILRWLRMELSRSDAIIAGRASLWFIEIGMNCGLGRSKTRVLRVRDGSCYFGDR